MEFDAYMTVMEIVEKDLIFEAIRFLIGVAENDAENKKEKYLEYRSSLRAIKKINAANIKSDAIDALCEEAEP